MRTWYSVSPLGWFVTIAHIILTVYTVRGLWVYDASSIEIEFFKGTTLIYAVLLTVLLYAYFTKKKLFPAKQ